MTLIYGLAEKKCHIWLLYSAEDKDLLVDSIHAHGTKA